jgi:hypothetical protein
MDGWMGEWMDGWVSGWIDRWMDVNLSYLAKEMRTEPPSKKIPLIDLHRIRSSQ